MAQDQRLGTLLGLQRGLLLQKGLEKKLLLPHAEAVREAHGDHCLVNLDTSKLRTPPLFAYAVREDLMDLLGPKDRVAWLYLAKLHALTGHVLQDPFTLRTGSEMALSLLRSARCRGNISEGDHMSSATAEVALTEIAKLSPARSSSKKGVAESVDFGGLEALCAHEGFGFLASNAFLEVQQQKELRGIPCAPCPDVMRGRCDRLAQRAYFRSSEIYGLPGRLERDEESSVQPERPWQAASWQESLESSCEGVRAVAGTVFCNAAAPKPSLKKLLLTVETLQGCVEFKCEELGVGDWEALSARGPRQMWIPLFQAVLRPKQEECGMMLGFFAHLWPAAVEHLQFLGSICNCRSSFADLLPPPYGCYERPSEKDFDAALVEAIIRRHLKAFDEVPPNKKTRREQNEALREYEARKQQHERCLEECLDGVQTRVVQKWRDCVRALNEVDCQGTMVLSAVDLASELNACFERWWRAYELHEFLDNVESMWEGPWLRLLRLWSAFDPSFRREPPPTNNTTSFHLLEPQASQLAKSPLDELWRTGTPDEQLVLEPPFQPPPRRCPELRLVPSAHCQNIYQEVGTPLQESWRLAHETSLSLFSHDYLPPSMRELLVEALETFQECSVRAWKRVQDAMRGRGRFDALLRACGLHGEPVPLAALSRLTTAKGQLQEAG